MSEQGVLKYRRISNIVVAHPALLSLMMGMARTALELWFNGDYKRVAAALNLSTTRKKLALLTAKESLSKTDVKWLFSFLANVKSLCLNTTAVKANLDAYPLNIYTWPLFKRLMKLDFHAVPLRDAWAKVRSGAYLKPLQGFDEWCAKQPKLPEVYKRKWRGVKVPRFDAVYLFCNY
jgi:hypothetical protein